MRHALTLLTLAAVALGAVALALAPACSSDPGQPDAALDAGADLLVPPPIQRTETEAQLGPKRAACAFGAGAWPAETIGTDYPIGADIPIDHVIVIEQENRSFDHYLGRLVAQGYYQASEIDVPPPGWSNPDGDGGTVVPHPDDANCFTANHGWNDMHDDYDNGALDHFVTNNNPNGQKSFYYEDDTTIPFYYALASTFSVGDRYFAPVMTSTWPNRLFLMAATSFGIGDNSFVTTDTVEHPAAQIFALLDAAGRTWKDYTDGPHQVAFFPTYGWQHTTLMNYADMKCQLLTDIQNDTLPDVAFVMGSEVGETSDEGPSALAGIGAELVEGLLRALFASPAWKRTVVFLTYDENGGMADHVPPAPACPPDSLAPHDGNGNALAGAFDKTGFRVPFIVVSPYARKHFVSHVVHDHTSITRFIEARFGLPALTARDANATPPMEAFDFANPPFLTPPTIAATTTVSPTVLQQCGQTEVKLGCSN
ncbi:MAG TPA: alkaline phosphatase family protein [Polyangiaceae bacterium]|nr:alkaline phosphatase family protein [Polyangiaceae bacterium]